MTYQWDNKKPTAQMLGRWQPFHDGHYTLFKEIIKKTGQVCIQIRDVQGVDDNPFDFETVKKNIEEKLNPEFEGRFKIMLVPNITNICYGRGVGYKIEEIVLSEEIQKISATHADATYQAKYGIQARSGGGRASARETIGRVAAGAIAKQLLKQAAGTEILAWVKRIHTIEASGIDPQQVQLSDVEANIVRCPEPVIAERMIERIEAIGREGDSCGGVIECVVRHPAIGLGMPVFDKLEADLAKAVMSLPATKGFEIGSGFDGTLLKAASTTTPLCRPTMDG